MPEARAAAAPPLLMCREPMEATEAPATATREWVASEETEAPVVLPDATPTEGQALLREEAEEQAEEPTAEEPVPAAG
jgi:hypothetical protein